MMYQAATAVTGDGLAIIAQVIGLFLAVVLHEVAHGYMALRLGDSTAYYAGRLTLNPIKHIDLWGTIIIPLFLIMSQTGILFGWAKPVPVNYYNLRHGKYGPVLVALAGPMTNFGLLVFFALLARFAPSDTSLPYLFFTIALVNGVLMFFNLIPLPPLDGSKVLYLFLDHRPDVIAWLERYSLYLLLGVMVLGSGLLSRLVFAPALVLTQVIAGF